MKVETTHKVYQIHLLLNQAMYLFEDLPKETPFLNDNEDLYKMIVKLCEDLTPLLRRSQNDNYTYTLGRLQKVIERVKIPQL